MRHTHPRPEFRSSRTFVANLLAFVLLASQLAPLASAQAARGGARARQQQPEKVKSEQPGKGERGGGEKTSPVLAAPQAVNIVATKVDSFPDPDSNGRVDPGATITYTVTISNTGDQPATGVVFTDNPDANTTLIGDSVNTSPIVAADAYNVIGNVRIQPNAAQGLLANDRDPDTGTSAGLTVTVLAGDNSAPFAGASAQGGQVTSSLTDGSFVYNPPAGYTGPDNFSYTVSDAGPDDTPGNADDTTDTATVSLQVGNGTATPGTNVIWFVNDDAPAGGDGRLSNPFNCYTGTSVPVTGPTCFSTTAADDPGDSIFLLNGNYAGGNTLLNNQKLIGQGAGATLAAVAGVTVEPYSEPLPATNGNPDNVLITTATAGTNAVPLAQGNLLRGFKVGLTTGAKIFGNNFGTLTAGDTVPDLKLEAGGQALNLTNGSFAATSAFNSVETTGATGAPGIALTTVGGTVSFGTTNVSGAGTQGINIAGSAVNATFGTTTVSSTTQGILIGTSTGAIAFGATTVTGGTDGVSLTNNTGGTRTFASLTRTGGSAVGFLHSTGGGATTVTGATTITNPGGTGISIQNSTTAVDFGATTVNKGTTAGTGVDLGSNSGNTTFNSLGVTASNGTGLLGVGNTGQINVTTNGGSIAATNGPAINITKAAAPATPVTLNFATVGSTNSTTQGVNLDRVSGNLAATTTTISNSTGTGIQVQNTSAGGTMSFGNTSASGTGNANADATGMGVFLNANAGGVAFADLDILPDGNERALQATNNTGTITTTSGDISATGNVTLEITGASAAARTPLAITLTDISSTNSPTAGVNLNFVSGSLTVPSAGAGTDTSITNPTGIGLQVQNTGAGTVNFGDTNVGGSGSTGISLTNNIGAVAFGQLDIAPDSGQRGLHATDTDAATTAGAISATSGTIATTSGSAGSNAIAIEIVGASAASRTPINLTFNTVSANNALNGIVLNNTSDGGNAFRTLGTGATDGTGGTISNITNRGASFVNADDIILNNMTFTNVGTTNGQDPTNANGTCGGLQSGTNTGCNAGIHADGVTGLTLTNVDLTTGAQQGVNGNNVTNFVFSNSNVSAFGNEVNEVGVRFNNLLGASSMTNVHVFNNHSFQVEIQNESGTLTTFPVTNSEFNDSGTGVANGVDGMLFSAQGTAVMNINITGCNFHDTFSGGFFSDSKGTATMGIRIQTSTFERFGSVPITIAKAESSNVKYIIQNNATIRDAGADASGVGFGININKASPSTAGTSIEGTISGNTIGESADTADADDKGSGIRLVGISSGAFIATVTNNNIQDFRERGITAQMSESSTGQNSMSLNITNNTVNLQEVVSTHGIQITAGALTNDNGTLCANITGNNSTSAGGNGIHLRSGGAAIPTSFILPGYAGAANDTAQLTAFVAANNPATTDTISAARLGIGTMTGGAACATPAAPPAGPIQIDSTPQTAQTSAGQIDAPPAQQQQFILPIASQPQPAAQVGGQMDAPPAPVAVAAASAAKPEKATARDAEDKSAELAKARKPAKPSVVAAPNALQFVVNIGTLNPQDSVTITFQVTVNTPFPAGVTQVSNQGTVSGTNFSNVLTDDPDAAGAANPTVTLVQLPPDINIRDASVNEPASGTRQMAFAVTLSTPAPAGGVTVQYSTASGGANPATGGDCATPGNDYASVSGGNLSFAPGEQVKTASITVCSDIDVETDETFLVNLSNAAGGNIVDGTATGTITTANPAGTTLISELRTSGPGTLGTGDPNDEFVEVYNNTDAAVTVTTTDGSPGWGLYKMGAACADSPVLIGTIPNSTVIPGRGHYLFVGTGYSLGGYAAGNQTLTSGIEDDRNVALFTTTNAANLATGTRKDAVGFGANEGGNCDLLREGTNLAPAQGSISQYTFVRNQTTGTPLDRNDNAGDFLVLSATPATAVGATSAPRLGAPGPENLTSPVNRSANIKATLADPLGSPTGGQNRVRVLTPDAANNSTFGTLAIRRKFTNSTGGQVTRLRFRVIDVTTCTIPPCTPGASAPAGVADLRVRTSSTSSFTPTGGGPSVTVQGLTLETPPAQPNGGGWNSTVAAGTITTTTVLAAGASINVEFLLGLQQTGTFRFFIIIEADPGGPPFIRDDLAPDAKVLGRGDSKDVPQKN